MPAGPGTHQVCVYAINTGPGTNILLGCSTITRPTDPFGYVDGISTSTPEGVRVTGWAIDPDTTDPVDVHVYVDNTGVARTANTSRPDVGNVFPAYGPDHGYDFTVPAGPGTHQVLRLRHQHRTWHEHPPRLQHHQPIAAVRGRSVGRSLVKRGTVKPEPLSPNNRGHRRPRAEAGPSGVSRYRGPQVQHLPGQHVRPHCDHRWRGSPHRAYPWAAIQWGARVEGAAHEEHLLLVRRDPCEPLCGLSADATPTAPRESDAVFARDGVAVPVLPARSPPGRKHGTVHRLGVHRLAVSHAPAMRFAIVASAALTRWA